MSASDPDQLQAALDALRRAYDDAMAVITAQPTDRDRFTAATRLFKLLGEIDSLLGDYRVQTAARIGKAEGLSYRKLEPLLGVSKSRIGQIMRAAERQTRKGEQTR